MKNTTLGRSHKTGLKANQGTSHEPRRNDQAGDGRDFAFNGQMGDGVNRAGDRGLCANPNAHMVKNPDRINHGLDTVNRRGNGSDSHRDRMESIGPSATKDAQKMTIATAQEGGRINGGAHVAGFKNPDAINVGMKR